MRKLSSFLLLIITISCSTNPSNAKKEVLTFVNSFYETWAVQEDWQDLQNYFSENFITISPSDSFRLSGKDNNILGYRRFLESTDILFYEISDEDVQLYNNGKSAVVSLYYNMLLQLGQDSVKASGRDMLFLVKEKDKWQIVADHFSNFPKE